MQRLVLMDPRICGFSGPSNEVRLGNQRFENDFFDQSREFGYLQSNLVPNKTPSASSVLSHEEPSPEECEFSDAILSYISQILMEEDMEDKTCMLHDSLDLQIAERSFYEVIGEKYPSSLLENPSPVDPDGGVGDRNFSENYGTCSYNDGDLSSILTNFRQNLGEFPNHNLRGNSISQSSCSSSNSVISSVEGPVDSPSSILQVPDLNSESQSILQFQKGVEEASKFLPSGIGLFANLGAANFSKLEPKMGSAELSVKVEKDVGDSFLAGSKFRGWQEAFMARREALQTKSDKTALSNGKSKASNSGKGRSKKQSGKKEVVDLRTLLVLCAQAVAADDYNGAHEFLKRIRKHSNPFGDGNQRLAHIFADGLEARLAGTGSQIYKGLVSKRTSAADFLKAYHLYLAACPFRKMASFVSNITIRTSSSNSARVHVIDFGILYGFQWPNFIQRLSLAVGGPPKLRITGIDFPQPGFRPAERIVETGRRLAAYAEIFKVPFEYNAIAKKWETVQLEELKIDRDEEALFHYSSLFDMLETIVPQEDWERMLIEKEIFGREALNVIACEGCERVERPETYRQWQARILRAGFSQQSFEHALVKRAIEKVSTSYHKDFVIDEDSQWLLQGWKGRIVYALSCWKPA
ncbi:hypothetical protein ACSQ67_016467 [Phaseolus vulgaris]